MRFIALTLVAAIVGTAAIAGGGANPYDKIGKDNPAFEDSGKNSIQNKNNNELRFGAGGRVAIPGNGAGNANEKSAVSDYSTGGSGGIVTPRGRN